MPLHKEANRTCSHSALDIEIGEPFYAVIHRSTVIAYLWRDETVFGESFDRSFGRLDCNTLLSAVH